MKLPTWLYEQHTFGSGIGSYRLGVFRPFGCGLMVFTGSKVLPPTWFLCIGKFEATYGAEGAVLAGQAELSSGRFRVISLRRGRAIGICWGSNG